MNVLYRENNVYKGHGVVKRSRTSEKSHVPRGLRQDRKSVIWRAGYIELYIWPLCGVISMSSLRLVLYSPVYQKDLYYPLFIMRFLK